MVDSLRQKSETAAHDLEQIQVYPPCIPGWWFQPSWQILVKWEEVFPDIMENKIDVPNHQQAM